MNTKKLAVIGYGQRGSIYANYALQNPEEFVVTAIVDNDENRRKLAASKHDCPVFSDYREFLAAGESGYFNNFASNVSANIM